MPRMLGERVLPESVQARRRQIRNRVTDLRQPIRNRRQNLVPGPDLIGEAETRFMNLRDRVVDRNSVLSRIKEASPIGNDNGGGSNSASNSGGSNSSSSGGSSSSSSSSSDTSTFT